MASENIIDIKDIIDILKRETSLGEVKRYLDWEAIDETGTRRKDDFLCSLYYQKIPLYEIGAKEFLYYAKQDLGDDSDRGRVNALTNAKRAIECRVDECLKLLNLNTFSSQHGWKLPYKIQVLQTFKVSAPSILRRRITSKRNLLEHEYIKPRNQEDVQDIVEIAELYIEATDKYVARGYLSSIAIDCTAWFEEKESGTGELLPRHYGMQDEYKLDFDFKNDTLILTHSARELVRNIEKDGNEITKRTLKEDDNKESVTIKIRDCQMEDIRELMIVLMQKENES